MALVIPAEEAIERVMRHVKLEASGCLTWVGSTNGRGGYGRMTILNEQYYPHRIIYEATFGTIPHGLMIDHLCRNRKCCNPMHLEPVTNLVNTRRGLAGHHMKEKKRLKELQCRAQS